MCSKLTVFKYSRFLSVKALKKRRGLVSTKNGLL